MARDNVDGEDMSSFVSEASLSHLIITMLSSNQQVIEILKNYLWWWKQYKNILKTTLQVHEDPGLERMHPSVYR